MTYITTGFLDKAMESINNGSTMLISNYMHCWKIDKKVIDRFAKLGYDVLKIKNGSLLMLSGKKYVDVTMCKITIN